MVLHGEEAATNDVASMTASDETKAGVLSGFRHPPVLARRLHELAHAVIASAR